MLRQRQISSLKLFSILAVLVLTVTATASQVYADPSKEKSVGVAVSAVINTDMTVGVEVSQALGKALAEKLQVTTLSGSNAQALLPSAARDESCLGNASCLRTAGTALGVDELLMLIIIDIGDNYKIEATWIDVESGKTALRPAIDSPKDPALLAKSMKNQARTLLPDTKDRALPSNNNSVQNPVDGSNNSNSLVDPTGKRWTTTSKVMLAGGILSAGGWATYGLVRLLTCEKPPGKSTCTKNGSESTVDILGAVGTVAFTSTALFLYMTSDSGETPPPVAVGVSQDSFAFSYQGSF